MVRNRELVTTAMVVKDATASYTVGGIVPAGMKRWVTFILADPVNAIPSAMGFYFASVPTAYPTVASCAAAANRKLMLHLRGVKVSAVQKGNKQIPPKANPDTPLFSIAGGSYLGVAATLASGNLLVQYYDE